MESEPNSCKLYVQGMHCSSCELLIERKLSKHPEVRDVSVSLSTGTAELGLKGKTKPDIDSLNSEFSELGYRFSYIKPSGLPSELPLVRFQGDTISFNGDKLKKLINIAGWVGAIVFGFLILDRLQLGRYLNVQASSALPAFLGLGLIAGFSSCAALVGGLLLSLTKSWNDIHIDSTSSQQKASPYLQFHLARIGSFAIGGAALGLIGERINFASPAFFAAVTLVVSLVMVGLAIDMLGIRNPISTTSILPKRLTRRIVAGAGGFAPPVIGALTFFLPCGFTLTAQTIALASGSALQGGLIMLSFVLGTLPTLLGISMSGVMFNRRPQLTARFNIVAGLVVLFFASYNINSQLNVLGLPSLNDLQVRGVQADETFVPRSTTDGVQEMKIIARGFDYLPDGPTRLRAGVPAKITVDNQGIDGCAAYMAATGLFPNYLDLKPGINTIEFTPRTGTYKLTCTMGMVAPVTITVV